MKKLLVPILCVLIGCAAGATIPSVTAQNWPASPNATILQQECEAMYSGGGGSARYEARTNELMRARGAQGWEFIGVANGLACFKRPAP